MKSHPVSPHFLLKSILFQRLRWRVLILGLSLLAATLGVAAPYAQKHFIDELLAGGRANDWVWIAFFLTLSAQGLAQLSLWYATCESLITQKSLGDAAYSRILEGPGGLVGRKPAGEAVSLFAVDVPGSSAILDQALIMAGAMIFPLLLTPIALLVLFKIPLSASFGTIFCLALINFVLAKKQSKYFYSFKQLAAERTGLVSEWVQNIRTLRILGWIKHIEKKIYKVRTRETRNRLRMVTNGQVMNSIATSGTYVLNILAVFFLLKLREASGQKPSPGELLSLLWILGVFLARPLRQFPWALVIGMDSYSSMVRLKKALLSPITQPQLTAASTKTSAKQSLALEILGLNLVSEGKTLLKNINLAVEPGELIGIVGEVGSGKTLLLQSLVGSTGASFNLYAVNGKITQGPIDPSIRAQFSFVPQEGFTMSASLRENVMFTYTDGSIKNPNYENLDVEILNSLQISQFDLKKERVIDGLRSEIGERGVNLSGGQKQRVSIARAHYAHRPIILLDDCLSAVDVDTESQLIEKLINGNWNQNTRLLATHRLSILTKCDRVLYMENGQIRHQGPYLQLYEQVPRFREFVRRGEIKAQAEAPNHV